MVLSRDHNEDETKQSSNTLSHIIHREIHLVTLLVLFSFPSSFGNYCNGRKTRLLCVNCVRGSDGRWYYDVPGKENSTKQAQMLFILFLIDLHLCNSWPIYLHLGTPVTAQNLCILCLKYNLSMKKSGTIMFLERN